MNRQPLFKVEGTDFTNYIVVPSYSVNESYQYLSWTDANYIEHKRLARTKIFGSFELFFDSISDYERFINLTNPARANQLGGYIKNVGVYCNNIMSFRSNINANISYEISNFIPLINESHNAIRVSIEER